MIGANIMSIEEFKGKYTEDAFTPDLEDMVNNPPHYNQHGIECLMQYSATGGVSVLFAWQHIKYLCDIDTRMEKRIYKKHYFIYK